MQFNEAMLLAFLFGVIGAAVGARNSGADAWKGAVIFLIGSLITFTILILFAVESGVLSFLTLLLMMGLTAAVMKLKSRQTSLIVIGSILGTVIGSAVGGLI